MKKASVFSDKWFNPVLMEEAIPLSKSLLKKILYFLERIRNTYLLETDVLNADFIDKLHLKSGKKKGEIKLLINYIVKLNNAYECSEQDLVRLNNLIEKFYKK